jgi:hypothetical protein
VLPLCVTYHLDVSMYVLFPVFAYLGIFMCVFCCSMLHLVVSRCTCNVCDFQGNFLTSSPSRRSASPRRSPRARIWLSILVDAPKRCARAPTLIVHDPFTIHTRRLRRIKVQGSFLMTYPYCIPSAFST